MRLSGAWKIVLKMYTGTNREHDKIRRDAVDTGGGPTPVEVEFEVIGE